MFYKVHSGTSDDFNRWQECLCRVLNPVNRFDVHVGITYTKPGILGVFFDLTDGKDGLPYLTVWQSHDTVYDVVTPLRWMIGRDHN